MHHWYLWLSTWIPASLLSVVSYYSACTARKLIQNSDNDASGTFGSGDHNNNNNDGISHISKQQKGDAMDLV